MKKPMARHVRLVTFWDRRCDFANVFGWQSKSFDEFGEAKRLQALQGELAAYKAAGGVPVIDSDSSEESSDSEDSDG